jgi:hypothetical protein
MNLPSRHEGYFRLEWDLADQRTHRMARNRVFIVPVCLDSTPEAGADVPESFASVQPPAPAAFTPPPHSIAVLPFVNMSGDKDQEYFSDGLTEELLNSLAAINALQVAARTSAFSFKGKDTDIGTIARKLRARVRGAILRPVALRIPERLAPFGSPIFRQGAC